MKFHLHTNLDEECIQFDRLHLHSTQQIGQIKKNINFDLAECNRKQHQIYEHRWHSHIKSSDRGDPSLPSSTVPRQSRQKTLHPPQLLPQFFCAVSLRSPPSTTSWPCRRRRDSALLMISDKLKFGRYNHKIQQAATQQFTMFYIFLFTRKITVRP